MCGRRARRFFVPLIFDARIYSQYIELHSNTAIPRPFDWATPTLGSVLHKALDINGMWARLVPSLFRRRLVFALLAAIPKQLGVGGAIAADHSGVGHDGEFCLVV